MRELMDSAEPSNASTVLSSSISSRAVGQAQDKERCSTSHVCGRKSAWLSAMSA